MMYSYWFCNFFCWVNMITGIILGAIGWRKFGKTIEKIWKDFTSK